MKLLIATNNYIAFEYETTEERKLHCNEMVKNGYECSEVFWSKDMNEIIYFSPLPPLTK